MSPEPELPEVPDLPEARTGHGPDGGLGEELRAMWELLDPVPGGLADRVSFALEMGHLSDLDVELELLRLLEEDTAGAGSRGDQVRTITFGGDRTTLLIALSEVTGGYRIDGWVAPGGRRVVEVRTSDGAHEQVCDATGRFAVPVVPPGHLQLLLHDDLGPPDEDGPVARAARRSLVTPALTL